MIQADVGGWHAAAVTEDGELLAWGGNEYLQCGPDDSRRDIVTPQRTFVGHKVRGGMGRCCGLGGLS